MAAPSTEQTRVTEEAGAVPRAALVIGILFFIFFLGSSDNQMISPLLPLIAREFGMPEGAVGQLIGPAYSLAAAAAALIIGPLSDRFGRRRFLLYGSILFGASLTSVAFIHNPVTMAGVRLFTGLAAGTFSTCSIAYVGDYFPYKRRGVAMSVVQAGQFAALVVGVQIANNLASWRGWRLSFEAFGIMALAAFVFVFAALPDDSHHARAESAARSRFENIGVVFGTSERIASIAAAFFVSGGFFGFFFYLGSWMRQSLAFATRDFDVTFALIGIALLLGVVLAGPLSNRVGARVLSIVSTVVLAALLVGIPSLGRSVLLYASVMSAALAFALRQGPLAALATELVPRHARGALVAARNCASQIGISAALYVSGSLFDKYGYRGVGIFSAAMSFAAAVCIFWMNEPRSEKKDD
ncbi:MAG TPA: MFS transporter [Blastocatellia bacterium]|nr:MFS transporter [Blastocatellia bacterium]